MSLDSAYLIHRRGYMQELLSQPVPIIFTCCQGWQQLATGGFNLLGIFDRLTVGRLPDGRSPDAVNLQVVTVWTGGQGEFEQVLRVLDQDGQQVVEARLAFSLPSTSARTILINMLVIPVREGVYTITVGRGQDELLRQDFTLLIGPLDQLAQ